MTTPERYEAGALARARARALVCDVPDARAVVAVESEHADGRARFVYGDGTVFVLAGMEEVRG